MGRPSKSVALMVDGEGAILAVREPFVAEKLALKWFFIASDADIPEPIHVPADMKLLSNPRRHEEQWPDRESD